MHEHMMNDAIVKLQKNLSKSCGMSATRSQQYIYHWTHISMRWRRWIRDKCFNPCRLEYLKKSEKKLKIFSISKSFVLDFTVIVVPRTLIFNYSSCLSENWTRSRQRLNWIEDSCLQIIELEIQLIPPQTIQIIRKQLRNSFGILECDRNQQSKSDKSVFYYFDINFYYCTIWFEFIQSFHVGNGNWSRFYWNFYNKGEVPCL